MADPASTAGPLHALLARQLRRYEGTPDAPPALWKDFVTAVDQAYVQADDDRALLERSMGLASQELMQRNDAMRTSMERYRTLVESTNAVPWEMDGASFTFSYISPMVTKLFGYGVHDIVGHPPSWDRIHADDRERVKGHFDSIASARDGEELDIEYRYVTAQGRTVHVRSMVRVHRDAAEDTVTLRGITLDITLQKKLEMELRQAQKLESVGRLAAGVAHEINTPIQFVNDSIFFVRDAMKDLAGLVDKYRALHRAVAEGTPVSDAIAEVTRAEEDADLPYLLENIPKALDRSLDGAGRVATIVRSMKAFAHPDQKEMAPVDLNHAIRSTLTIARNEYKYVAEVETDLGDVPLVTCHGGDLNQAILNIVVNAAHAIADRINGTNQKGRITLRTRREGDYVVIAIGDTGGGIPEGIRERIFDPFFTTKEVGRGTGQGLAISRSVILEHGGDLTFETEMGRGTTFLIRLPIEGGRIAMGAAV
jgi:PAS domain S-box-containing protein